MTHNPNDTIADNIGNNRKPNFFIMGAPKCGTSSIRAWLSEHSSIYMVTHTEACYFADDYKNRWVDNLVDYQALFTLANDSHTAIGEKSARYLYSQNAAAAILAYNADARFIVMLRNPIDMVRSWHNQLLNNSMENVTDFQSAWQLQKERKAGRQIPFFCTDAKVLNYGAFCCLGEQLQRLYKQVPAERVHIIFFDDLIQNSRQVYVQVLDFLGVADDNKQDFSVYNSATQNRNYFVRNLLHSLRLVLTRIFNHSYINNGAAKIKEILGIKRRIGLSLWVWKVQTALVTKNKITRQQKPLSTPMRQTLITYFSKDIALLSQITKRNLDHWLT